jgi:phosphohistidine phosphatase
MSDRTLVILRHAKAAWPDGVPDEQRPLAERGRRDAPVAGRWLQANVAPLDHVVRSPAVRVEQTWDLVSAELTATPETEVDRRLYAEPVSRLIQLIRELPDGARTVLLLGHNPELSGLASALSGEETVLETASVAVLSAPGGWHEAAPGWFQLTQTITARA